jgi:c-di-GMP-binding flagellar brake protein YcgR
MIMKDMFDERYALDNPLDIAGVLKELACCREKLAGIFNESTLMSMLVHVDYTNGHVYLDTDTDLRVNHAVLEAEKITFATTNTAIAVAWEVENIKLVKYQGLDTFKIDMPDVIYRRQRREHFRVEVPKRSLIEGFIPIGDGSTASINVLNISAGGIACEFTGTGVVDDVFQPGAEFVGCVLNFPEIGPIPVKMIVRRMFTQMKGDIKVICAGMEFQQMRMAAESHIHKYINTVESQSISGH